MKRLKKQPCYQKARDWSEAQKRAEKIKAQGQYELDGALDTAVRFRDVLLARALLEQGADANGRDANNQTVLGHALDRGSIELVDLLLEFGADINGETIMNTPLVDAVYKGDWPMVQHLLKAGANVNKVGHWPITALYVAAKNIRSLEGVKLLLEAGANPLAKDVEGLAPIDWAKRNGDEEIVRLLQRAAKSRSKGKPRKKVQITSR